MYQAKHNVSSVSDTDREIPTRGITDCAGNEALSVEPIYCSILNYWKNRCFYNNILVVPYFLQLTLYKAESERHSEFLIFVRK